LPTRCAKCGYAKRSAKKFSVNRTIPKRDANKGVPKGERQKVNAKRGAPKECQKGATNSDVPNWMSKIIAY
jgi:hypothetical protein